MVVSEVPLVDRPLFDVSEEISVSWSDDETESDPSSVCEVLTVLSTPRWSCSSSPSPGR